MMSKKISFIVPIYNVAPYLAECLDSLVNQSVSKQIILVDDGSTDNSFAIAQDYFQRYPDIVLIQQHNAGVSAARNMGLRCATGQYVYFVDSDDFLLEKQFDLIVQLAIDNQADMVKGQIQRSDEHQHQATYLRPSESPRLTETNQYELVNAPQHLHDMLRNDLFPSVFFGLYRTEFLRQHNIQFAQGITMSEDGLFVLQTLLSQADVRILEISRPFYNYRIRSGSALTQPNNPKGVINIFAATERMWQCWHQVNQANTWLSQLTPEVQQQLTIDVLRFIVVHYHIAYRFQYLKYSPEIRQQVRHLFTPNVEQLIKQFCGYDVV